MRTGAAALLVIGLVVACDEPSALDAGVDAGPDEEPDAGPDAGPPDAGPPPPMVPAEGWANAIADSDVAATIESDGATFTNVASDPSVMIGAPDGLSGSVALGDAPHYVVVDLGEGEEAFDGPGVDVEVREIDFTSGGAPEPYAVLVAEVAEGPFTPIGEAEGSGRFDLEGSGLASVRYVRVESTRTAAEILDSAGSPTYPGAEIDAVGAYYPGAVPAPAP